MFPKGNQKVVSRSDGGKGVAIDHPVVHSACLASEALVKAMSRLGRAHMKGDDTLR